MDDFFLKDVCLSSLDFISDSEFERVVTERHELEDAIDWIDLAVGIIYCIQSMLAIKTRWGGPQVILKLRNRDGNEVKVWSPSNVNKEINTGIRLNRYTNRRIYIRSLGQKEAKTNTGGGRKWYFDFDSVYS